MKKIKLILVLFVVLIGTTILSNCQHNDFDELNQEAEHLEKKKPTKFIYYQGLKVKHRFKSTEKELKVKHNKKSLKALYYKMKVKKKNGSISQGKKIKSSYEINNESFEEEELPSNEAIVEAAKVVLPSFPYEEIEGYAVINRPNKHALDHGMVKQDFPDLTDAEIEANESIIDQYYSDNLDYMVLDEIAENPSIYESSSFKNAKSNSYGDKVWTATCILSQTLLDYGLVRPAISFALASDRSTTSSVTYYGSLPSSNSRRDAYRHMLWSSLLAQYYFTVSSKSKRLSFAKTVTDLNESSLCGSTNEVDSREMDFHNNVIGRQVWDDNTTYRTIFGITIGLNMTNTSHLKDLIREKIDKNGLFIVKTHEENSNFNYSDIETQAIILQTDVNTPVYFSGSIAPVYETNLVLEYYNCETGNPAPKVNDNDKVLLGKAPVEDEEEYNCTRYVTIYTPIYQQYMSNDLNYNPYFRHATNPFK